MYFPIRKLLVSAVLVLLVSSVGNPLLADSISILVTGPQPDYEFARIYQLDVTTGVASDGFEVSNDAGKDSAQEQFSPNALGVVEGTGLVGGSYAYTTFNQGGGSNPNETFFNVVGGTETTQTFVAPTYAVAVGDISGDTYYYVDRDGFVGGFDNISSGASATPLPLKQPVNDPTALDDTLGDMAILGELGYISVGNSMKVYNFATNAIVDELALGIRFAGLGFVGTDLFGVRRDKDDGLQKLYQIDTTTLETIGDATLISGLEATWEITDASRTLIPSDGPPVPEPTSFALFSLMGLGALSLAGRRRRY